MKKRSKLLILIILLVSLTPLSAFGKEANTSERKLPRFVDNAGLLTEEESDNLTKKLDEVSKRQNLDVVIITVDSLEGRTATEVADDTFDYNGFGMGKEFDGILLLISMEDRDWVISTRGYGITVFTDAGQKYMVDQFMEYISDGDYYKGFDKFADLSDQFISQARTDMPYDSKNLPKEPMSPIWIGISILGGAFVALVITGVMRSSLTSVTKQRMAGNYIVNTVMEPNANMDLYLYSVVTKTAKPKENEGGSSTHTSSSGSTHGGSSGKF